MKEKIFGVLYLLIGLFMTLGLIFVFPVCEMTAEGTYMKCHWMSQAELGIGIIISILGIISLISKSKELKIGINISLILQFLLVILIPDILIGVCKNEHMRCHSLSMPILNILGGIGIIVTLINFIYFSKSKNKQGEKHE